MIYAAPGEIFLFCKDTHTHIITEWNGQKTEMDHPVLLCLCISLAQFMCQVELMKPGNSFAPKSLWKMFIINAICELLAILEQFQNNMYVRPVTYTVTPL